MCKYLTNEIIKFQNENIPIIEYATRVKNLRQKINNYINAERLYIGKLLYSRTIGQEEYQQLLVIVEYDRVKYHNLVNQR